MPRLSRDAFARAIARVTGRTYRLTRLTRHSLACCQTSPDSPDTPPAWFQISRDSQTLTCMFRSPCQTHLTLSCVLPDSPGTTDTLAGFQALQAQLRFPFHATTGFPFLWCSVARVLTFALHRWSQTGPRLGPPAESKTEHSSRGAPQSWKMKNL